MKINEYQTKVINILKESAEPLTLEEINQKTGLNLKSGAIVGLIGEGLITSIKNGRVIKCACCGHSRKVSTYTIAK